MLLACDELVCFLRLNKSAVDGRVGHCELADDVEDEAFSTTAQFRFVIDDFKFVLASSFLRPAMALCIRFCSSSDSTSSSVITSKIDISFDLFECDKRGFFTGIREDLDDDNNDDEPFFVLLHESLASLL